MAGPLELGGPSYVSRRYFLKAGAALGGGLMIGWHPQQGAAADAQPFSPNAFLRIDRAGKVTFVCPAVEMGQGTYTSLPMLAAEELDVALDQISVEPSPPSDKLYGNPAVFNAQITGGSMSVHGFFKPLREAGAAARQMLMSAAAARLKVDIAELQTEPGAVVHAKSGTRLAYGALVDDAAKLPVPTGVALKDPANFRIIGTPAKRLDVAGKIDGTAVYGIDVKVPGMKVATVAASPVFGGKLASLDEAAALAVPGVRQIAKIDNAVAVIADHYWAARKGLEAARPKFDDGPHGGLSTSDVVAALAKAATERKGAVAERKGDADAAMANAEVKLDSTYENPFLAHATMEPMNCTVHVTPDGCDIWVGTQIPSIAQSVVSKALDLPLEKVRVHNHLLGGGFGRRLEFDFILQAALFAKQVKDPIKVIWSREEDIQHDMYRPYYYDRISAGLDGKGNILAWKHRIVGSAIVARFAPSAYKDDLDSDAVDGAIDLNYDLPNTYVDYVREEPFAIPTAFWRGVGPTRSAFVVEGFIDELAAAVNTDPVEFRRRLLVKSPRALHVLERAAALSGWGTPLGPRKGRGISVMKAMGSYIAQVAEVTVAPNGEVHVDRVVVAVDCGLAVNPDTIVAQMQSGIIFGITAVLWGEITIKNGRVEQSNFDDYRIVRLNEAPKIEVEIVKSNDEPSGIGEPGTCALAPAVVNAVYAATGVRVRKLPLKAALPGAS
ncbi:MAG: xanthine dehydrogenase family protein molybdopterin-binding subunit [Hyphomicrobium sp.]|jgi:isoquinoline 1-oxidoreductase beta subunit